jgi:hypothetical protein
MDPRSSDRTSLNVAESIEKLASKLEARELSALILLLLSAMDPFERIQYRDTSQLLSLHEQEMLATLSQRSDS